jgi:hypothetical protein
MALDAFMQKDQAQRWHAPPRLLSTHALLLGSRRAHCSFCNDPCGMEPNNANRLLN